MTISICMITYNKVGFLKKSLPVIVNSITTKEDVEFIVLDNGSNDGTSEYLGLFEHVCPSNIDFLSVSVPKNVGLNGYGLLEPMTSGDMVVTVDDDIFEISPPGWEDRFRKVLAGNFEGKRFGYVSTDTINEDGGRMSGHAMGFARLGGLEIEVGIAGGWLAATSRDVLKRVGGFHTGMPEMYLEDADFQNRVWRAGFLVGTLLDTKVWHARSPSYYVELGCEETYRERERLALEVGIELERIT